MNWFLWLMFLPSFGVAQDQAKHDAQWMRIHATDQEYSAFLQAEKAKKAAESWRQDGTCIGFDRWQCDDEARRCGCVPIEQIERERAEKSKDAPKDEDTGNPNLDFVHRLQNQQVAAEKRKTEVIEKSLEEVPQAGKASIQELAEKISKKCKIQDSWVEANNWGEISGLSVSIRSNCPQPITKIIESLNEIRREKKQKSVKSLSFFDSVDSYRSFPVVQVVIVTGYVEYGNGSRRAITTTYAFSTQILDSYLHGKIGENEFMEKVKTIVTTPQ